MRIATALTLAAIALSAVACGNHDAGAARRDAAEKGPSDMTITRIEKSDAEWRDELTEQQYDILRRKGTERAYTGEYWDNKDPGVYHCAACDLPLYPSETKFESGTGWPSFWAPVEEHHIDTAKERTLFLGTRIELLCARCGGHLGHVFDDGPEPTGKRHCINSAALKFHPADAKPDDAGT